MSAGLVFGHIAIRFERSDSKRADIALFALFKVMEHLIYANSDLYTGEREHEHAVLGSDHLPCGLFAIACALLIYVYYGDGKQIASMKSVEKQIISFILQ